MKLKTIITEDEYAKFFWKGIPKNMKGRVELLYLQSTPNHDMTTPFSVALIIRALEKMFAQDRFGAEDSDTDSDSDTDDDSNERTSSDDDSEYSNSSDWEVGCFKHKSKKHSKKSQKTVKDLPVPTTTSAMREQVPMDSNQSKNEVEEIITRLQKVSLDDPSYAALYY